MKCNPKVAKMNWSLSSISRGLLKMLVIDLLNCHKPKILIFWFISDFLKGIELLLLGCFKVIMQWKWTYLSWSVQCSGTTPEPWGTCQTSFHLFKANPVDHQHQILDGLQRGSFLKKTIIQCKGELIFDFFFCKNLAFTFSDIKLFPSEN